MRALPFLAATAAALAAPLHAAAQKPPDTVFLEELTWDEVKDLMDAGATSVIIPTAGTEQKGPHMVEGEHRFVVEYTSDRIARQLGNALVAPTVTYVPEGSWENPRGHMTKAGSITLPQPWFEDLLEHTARSLAAGGFKDIIFLGDSGGNQAGMKEVTDRLNAAWAGTGTRAHFIGDYYTKSGTDIRAMLKKKGYKDDAIGSHAGIMDTGEMMFVNPAQVRLSRLAPQGGGPDSGVSGDPTQASAVLGEAQLRIKIDDALAQIRRSMGVSAPAPDPNRALPASRQWEWEQATGAPYIERMTWTEIRDAIDGGATTVIVPTGGTEQNGPHMVLGKHNYIVTYTSGLMAHRLGNALVAPTLQYVPEGDYDRPGFGDKPGVITNPEASYEHVLEAAARSLKVHGFKDILFIGDSGGNQAGFTAVADKLNAEWAGTDTHVYALTDYYRKGHEYLAAWLTAAFGWDEETIGSHAGVEDTSGMLWVHPSGIRRDKIAPNGGSPDAGVHGDPTKATASIGRMAMEFKVNAGLAQYRALKAPPRRRTNSSGNGRPE